MNRICVWFCLLLCISITTSYPQWTKMMQFPASSALSYMVNNDSVWIGTYMGGVYLSADGMESWTPYTAGLSTQQALHVNDIISYNGTVYIATDEGIYKFNRANNTWINKSNGLIIGGGATKLLCVSIYTIGNRLITGAFNGIYSSTDGGENWSLTYTSGSHVWARSFTLFNGKLYAARETNNTPNGFISSDSGKTWSPLPFQHPLITFLVQGDTLWAGSIDGAYFTVNNGATWNKRINGYSPDPYTSCFLPMNGIMFSTLKFGGSGVFATVNHGLQWFDVGTNANLPFISEISGAFRLWNRIVLVTSSGLYSRLVQDFQRSIVLADGWNLVALPLLVKNAAKNVLFPNATSQLYTYENGYVAKDSVVTGKGYWIRNNGPAETALFGIPDTVVSVPLAAGWNLISPKSVSTPVAQVTTQPAGILSSDFFGFQSGYQTATTLYPAKGYWIRSNSAGSMQVK